MQRRLSGLPYSETRRPKPLTFLPAANGLPGDRGQDPGTKSLLDANHLGSYSRLIPARDGRLPETVHRRSREWRSAAAARNRSPGRHGNRSPDTRTRPRGASLHALRRIMPEPEARTRGPKIATVERREARVPDRKGTRGASQAPRRANRTARQGCLASTPRRLGAPLPLGGRKVLPREKRGKENAAPAREWSAGGEAFARAV